MLRCGTSKYHCSIAGTVSVFCSIFTDFGSREWRSIRSRIGFDTGWLFHEGDVIVPPATTHEETYLRAKAGNAVAAIIGAGLIPAGLEMMDKPAIHATEEFVHAGYPLDVEALLIVELDGPEIEVDHLVDRVAEIAKGRGATTVRVSRDEQERVLFWAGRKAAFPAVGQITPDYMCLDGSVPRGRLVEVLAEMRVSNGGPALAAE